MSVLRNGLFAMVLLLPGGCMMMHVQAPHDAPMETASAGNTAQSKDASRQEAPTADREREMKQERDAPHFGNASGMAILGGALMVLMMLAIML